MKPMSMGDIKSNEPMQQSEIDKNNMMPEENQFKVFRELGFTKGLQSWTSIDPFVVPDSLAFNSGNLYLLEENGQYTNTRVKFY